RQRGRAALMEEVRADPLVQKVLERFPGAQITDIRTQRPEQAVAPADAQTGPGDRPDQTSEDQD
ncbi:MAG: DNA polymerase III subunit gamma/tau, partial [Rhizobiales bacterium]|nr:DNA polymerase III subunit gamma/tau [Hyphomicrobiales bacterium]